MKVGDRVVTPTGRKGEIVPPNADMPNHHLVQFDGDRAWWMLKTILKLEVKSSHVKRTSKTRNTVAKVSDVE